MVKHKRARGYMLSELLGASAIAIAMTSMAVIDVHKVIGRARSLSALSSIQQVLATARLHAVKRGVQVVVEVSVEPPPASRILLRTFEDRSGDFLYGTYTPAPPATAQVQEVILSDVAVDGSFHLWKKGGVKDDLASAALFNGYANDPTIQQRIAFQPDGGIVAPQSADSAMPSAAAGRGIYVADALGKSYYRITIATSLLARPRLDRWESAGYVPANGSY